MENTRDYEQEQKDIYSIVTEEDKVLIPLYLYEQGKSERWNIVVGKNRLSPDEFLKIFNEFRI